MKNKKRSRNFQIKINLTNRWLYTLIAIGILAIVGVGVYAFGTSNPSTFGHSIGEIQPCGEGKILKVSGGIWTCVDPSGVIDTRCDTSGTCSQVCIGTTCRTSWPSGISTNPLYVEGAITSPEGTLRDDGGGWVRTYGNTGWYSQTYGGGWYMTDTSWIRAYGDKNVYTPGQVQSGSLKVSGPVVTVGSACSESEWGELRKCSFSSTNSAYKSVCACRYYHYYESKYWSWAKID